MTEQRKGEMFLFAETLLWGGFPVVTALTYHALPSIVTFAWSVGFATLFFAGVLTYKKRWHELRNSLVWKYSLYIALLIGVIFYSCYFLALETTSPGTASIIALLEVFTSFLFFSLIGKEVFSREHTYGAILMILGAVVVLAPNFAGFNRGDLLIVLGTCVTPAGNFFQQRARRIASSETIMFLRSLLSLPFIILLAYALGIDVAHVDVRPALVLLLMNGLVMLGLSKLLWLEAIHRIPVTKGVALQSIGPFFTLVLAWGILSQTPTIFQLASLVPFIAGVLLLTDQIGLPVTRTPTLA